MNDQEQNEYVKKLPQAVQDFVYNGTWEERTIEIAKKYSLGPEQTDALANIVVLVLIGLEKPETFLDTIIADLGISRLLAEQIMADLETRVFEYALNLLENKNKPKIEEKPLVTQSNIPEIRPNTVPMVEKNVPMKEPQISVPRYIPPTPKPSTPEPVQRPVPVPRFNAVSLDEKGEVVAPSEKKPRSEGDRGTEHTSANVEASPAPAQPMPTTPIMPQNIMDNKLNSVVKSVAETNKPDKKYAIDPYREPAE